MSFGNIHYTPPSIQLGFARELLDAVPTGIIVAAHNGIITYINAEAERLFDYEADELLGQSIDILLPDQLSKTHADLRRGYSNEPTTRYMGTGRDLYGRRKDGSEFPIEVGLRPLTSGDEHMVVATIVDITKRKQLEEKFAKVIEASPYGKILVDDAGIIQLINASMLNLFGYQREELIGQSMDILLPERYRLEHSAHRRTYAQRPTLRAMGIGRDLTGLHKNGTEIPIEIGLNPVDSEKGQLVLAVITDITERKRLELNYQQANAHMEEFTYVASHDLKSPLRGIADLVDWIAEDLGEGMSESVQKNIHRIKIRIGRMERLTDDLLHYARSGARVKESNPVDVASLIQNVFELQPIPEHFVVSSEVKIDCIQAAKTPLETVLRNLFSNAIKHHDGLSPVLSISAEADGNYCIFTVSDNGPGIPVAAHERVFRLFQTLNNKETDGTGIGLAIAKRLTESHGGKIELIAYDGKRGCCFRVWWPRFARRDIYE